MQTNGILAPQSFGRDLVLERVMPPPAIAAWVERFWPVRWDLAQPRESPTLPYPCVNMVFGTHRDGVHGTTTSRFVAQLEGRGWVLGTKFKPAGFRTLCDRPMHELVDHDVPVAVMFGNAGADLDRVVRGATLEDQIAAIADFVVERAQLDPEADALNTIVDQIEASRDLVRVAEVAARVGIPVRSLERMFRVWIGVSPKWVITRFRVQEAAARVAAGEPIGWTALAHELGYFDQAHFIREFKAQVGTTPAQYAASVGSRTRSRAAVRTDSHLPSRG
ncbi:MAG: AraC family transcriptional regulator [Kofleriaceae bacterium]